ncbi:hypothetical protein ACFWDG_21595 [Peribacillus sp. NPDC060186]
MKKICFMLAFLVWIPLQGIVDAHPGSTDSSDRYNCSEKSQAKGLCSGYHSHIGGGIKKHLMSLDSGLFHYVSFGN